MTEIIKNPIEDIFLELCANSTQSIKLCAPFVKNNIIEKIITHKQMETSVDLLTNVNMNSFYKKASDLKALSKILEMTGYVYNCGKLHAKYYIFDDEKAIITSGNLTHNGLNNNYEYGVLINEKDLINQIVEDYSSICSDELTGKVIQKQLDEIEKLLIKIPTSKICIPDIKSILLADMDTIISVDPAILSSQFTGWRKYIFEIINRFPNEVFTTDDFAGYIHDLQNKYPKNKHIAEKIRQQLQELRDIGLIEFASRGNYKRLWATLKGGSN